MKVSRDLKYKLLFFERGTKYLLRRWKTFLGCKKTVSEIMWLYADESVSVEWWIHREMGNVLELWNRAQCLRWGGRPRQEHGPKYNSVCREKSLQMPLVGKQADSIPRFSLGCLLSHAKPSTLSPFLTTHVWLLSFAIRLHKGFRASCHDHLFYLLFI